MQNTLLAQVQKYAQQRVVQEYKRAEELEATLPRSLRTHQKWNDFMEFAQDMHEGSDEYGALFWIVQVESDCWNKDRKQMDEAFVQSVRSTFENFLEMEEDRAADAAQ